MGSFLLDTLIVGSFLASQQGAFIKDPEYSSAMKHASLAYFRQSGFDTKYKKTVDKYEDVYKNVTTDTQRQIFGWTAYAIKTAQDGYIVFSWEF